MVSKIKTKLAFNLTKRQLICFSAAASVGLPTYLLTRGALGNSAAMLLMIGLMLPFFFFAMYEKDGLPLEKVLKNIIRTCFLYPRVRPYLIAPPRMAYYMEYSIRIYSIYLKYITPEDSL